MERTKAGRAATLTESFVALDTLMTLDGSGNYEDVELANTGDTELRIAVGTATDAYSRTLAAGKSLFLAKANLSKLYAKTVDDAGDNILEFVGTPV